MPSSDWYNASPLAAGWPGDKALWRSVTTVKRIMDKPTDIRIQRGGTPLDADQTVRIEGVSPTGLRGDRSVGNQQVYAREVVVFGVKDHAVLPDFDVMVGDRFGYNGEIYSVMGVTHFPGETQARATRYQK